MNQLGNYTEKEIGRMTFGKWGRLYDCYKDNFDLEMKMKNKNIGYRELEDKQNSNIDDVIPI